MNVGFILFLLVAESTRGGWTQKFFSLLFNEWIQELFEIDEFPWILALWWAIFYEPISFMNIRKTSPLAFPFHLII